ncbi:MULTISPECIES: amidohydrolase family protein [unclassified Halomonas]|uniref:amidohydrolase family protein n=1 Tax=unclassified Halomonas TaxID=2609666 RepID=UPI0020A22173|nr:MULTISPECIES: amidohydrolase family protein [unclassified Halomonas]MCP1315403.1 amidohydrolase family protein [Halomonas sp. 707D7]MCP1326600.1 amidohydrolase family protein [Halomonas sp. 707D4]
MWNQFSMTRRRLLGAMTAVAGSGLIPGAYAGEASDESDADAASESPRRWCIRNATVLTMEPGRAPLEKADVWVVDGRIEAIGEKLDSQDSEMINGEGCIVMPGLVDTHNHMWQTQMRGMFNQTENRLFFPLTNRLGEHFRPGDTWVGEYLAAMENVGAGITTSVDFFDNNRGPEHAQAALEALAASPLRARLMFGNESKTSGNSIDLEHLRELHDDWERYADRGRLSLGLAWRLPSDLSDQDAMTMKRREFEAARERGLPIAVHVSGEEHHAMFQRLIDGEFLIPELQVVHATDAREEHLDALVEAGSSLALTPVTEHRVGYGLTRLSHFARVERQGLGIDGNALAGRGDLFEVMKHAALTELGASEDQTSVDCERIVSLATRLGAESVGMGDQVGTLAPGKQADLIMLDTRRANLGMLPTEPYAFVVFAATPANVSLVSVGGRIAKRSGELVDIDEDELASRIDASLSHLRDYL